MLKTVYAASTASSVSMPLFAHVCSSIDPVYVVPGAELGGDGRSGVEVEKVCDERQKSF